MFVAGGGPAGLLHGSLLARRGHSVVLAERKPALGAGVTWNLSHEEWADLGRAGAFTGAQLRDLVVGDYEEGLFRMHRPGGRPPEDFHFDQICNLSVDEPRFCRILARTRGLDALTSAEASLAGVTRSHAFARVRRNGRETVVRSRLFLDARGWSSPLARAVHPDRRFESVFNIVGVHCARLARERSPRTGRPVGLIAATYEGEIASPAGTVQPILERFSQFVPGRVDGGEVLYYFTRTAEPCALAPMVDEMLARLPAMVPDFSEDLVSRTYYGHIPSWLPYPPLSRRSHQVSAGDRTLLVGCAGRQFCGLTGCAFGALARNADRLSRAIARRLRSGRLGFEALRTVDIDPRERLSQAVEELFGGIMALGPDEEPGSVNRDWTLFLSAARSLDPDRKNAAFRDKIPLDTLHELAGMVAADAGLIRALLRNNSGRASAVAWTLLRSYVHLLAREAGLWTSRQRTMYLRASATGTLRLPRFLLRGLRLFLRGRRLARQVRPRRQP